MRHKEIAPTFVASERLEPGEYRGHCRHTNIYRDGFFKRWICLLQFDVKGDSLQTIGHATRFINLGRRDKPHFGRRSDYFAEYVKAMGAAPKRADRVAPNRVFLGRMATIIIGDVINNFRDRKLQIAPELFYSVVREIKAWDNGPRDQPTTLPTLAEGTDPTNNKRTAS
jgi:hypothetical protein